jgi:XTP/dITP diphosphohydrolase
MFKLLLASRNEHKAEEIRSVLHPLEVELLPSRGDVPSIVEDAETFHGNAEIKTATIAQWLWDQPAGEWDRFDFVMADDSGLEVDALNGAPGVQSARFAALDSNQPGNSSDAANNAKLLRLLERVPLEKRTARFRCVLALVSLPPKFGQMEVSWNERTNFFQGTCKGHIDFSPRGSQGFGYDPLFIPSGLDQSFAELGEEIKNQISHRARALQKLKDYLSTLPRHA